MLTFVQVKGERVHGSGFVDAKKCLRVTNLSGKERMSEE